MNDKKIERKALAKDPRGTHRKSKNRKNASDHKPLKSREDVAEKEKSHQDRLQDRGITPKRSRTSNAPRVGKLFMKQTNTDDIVEEASVCARKTLMDETEPAQVEKGYKDDNRYKWAQHLMATKPIKLVSKEFIANKKVQPEYTLNFYEKNEAKNRYNDILCIDATRVILKNRAADKDYIHASWMTMPDGQRYICTQGPIAETVEDFWHMIFHEKSSVIVMLCGFTEGKHEKCRRYFPKNGYEMYGPYKVCIKESKQIVFDVVEYRVLEAEYNGDSFQVHHYGTVSWPDHTSPVDPGPITNLHRLAKEKSKGNPITVHCSAGIGRSATFVAIDYAAQKIARNSSASMLEVLRELRSMRIHSIQSGIQYIFLHICLLELFQQEGVLPKKGKYSHYLDSWAYMVNKYNKKIAHQQEKRDKEEEK